MAQQPSTIEMFIPFIAIFAIFYFMIIRPQGKKAKLQDAFLAQLKRGDEVITSAGIVGTVDGLTEQLVTLEIASQVKIKVLRKQIIGSAAQILTAGQKANEKASPAIAGKKG